MAMGPIRQAWPDQRFIRLGQAMAQPGLVREIHLHKSCVGQATLSWAEAAGQTQHSNMYPLPSQTCGRIQFPLECLAKTLRKDRCVLLGRHARLDHDHTMCIYVCVIGLVGPTTNLG